MMKSFLNQPLSHWNLNQSAYSSRILEWEAKFEKLIHVNQSPQQRCDNFSYVKGLGSFCVRTVFGAVAAVASLVETAVRLTFAGFTFVGASCFESWTEVTGNLWGSAVSFDRTNGSLSALQTFVISVALPCTEVADMIPRIWAAVF